MPPQFRRFDKPALVPQPGVDWADTMVLNPAIIDDPDSGRLHMLFRATGPYPSKRIEGKPLPYPIFLGYAWSGDRGETWNADFNRPALAPVLEYDREKVFVTDIDGKRAVNYANGCIEDPRLFYIGETLYLTAACRMFPPGPYWEYDEPMQCAPGWAVTGNHHFGRAAAENVTVNVLYAVDLRKLAQGKYEQAFTYVTHLTDPEYGENRDVVLFSEKLTVDGEKKYVMIHRPSTPESYPGIKGVDKPSIFIASSCSPGGFPKPDIDHQLYASPAFDWEAERIGASTQPLRISSDEWLLPYHGKKDASLGYTQSFMILSDRENSFPVITNRCPERLMYAQAEWEQPGIFGIPCIFTTGAIISGDDLLVSYGAADEKCGIAKVNLESLIGYVKTFNSNGEGL